jgi:hypothetical protein
MCPVIRISDETYQRLQQLAVGFDTPDKVIERMLDEKGVENKSMKLASHNTLKVNPDLPREQFIKINRMKGWITKNPRPNVGKIILAYLEYSCENNGVVREEFLEKLARRKVYDGEMSRIKSNLAQMKTDSSNEHGRVFYDRENILVMYNAVYHEARMLLDAYQAKL